MNYSYERLSHERNTEDEVAMLGQCSVVRPATNVQNEHRPSSSYEATWIGTEFKLKNTPLSRPKIHAFES